MQELVHMKTGVQEWGQYLRNYIVTSAFADISYLMSNVEAKFYV